jgi:hypothetical protein
MNDQSLPVAQITSDPATTLLLGAAVPAIGAGLGVSLLSLVAGPAEAASAGTGATLSIIALAAGPLLLRLGRGYTPVGLMALAVSGYGLVVITLGIAFALVNEASWLIGRYAAIGALVATGVWIAAQARSTSGLRILLYGDPTSDLTSDPASDPASAAQEARGAHR